MAWSAQYWTFEFVWVVSTRLQVGLFAEGRDSSSLWSHHFQRQREKGFLGKDLAWCNKEKGFLRKDLAWCNKEWSRSMEALHQGLFFSLLFWNGRNPKFSGPSPKLAMEEIAKRDSILKLGVWWSPNNSYSPVMMQPTSLMFSICIERLRIRNHLSSPAYTNCILLHRKLE